VGVCDGGDKSREVDDGTAGAEVISGEFNSQSVANTLWVYVTMGTKPGGRMMGQLERQSETIKSGGRMMGQLERRTETISGEFNSKSVANTLWEYARMGTKSGDRMMGQLERS
jgi:hypothetical protein